MWSCGPLAPCAKYDLRVKILRGSQTTGPDVLWPLELDEESTSTVASVLQEVQQHARLPAGTFELTANGEALEADLPLHSAALKRGGLVEELLLKLEPSAQKAQIDFFSAARALLDAFLCGGLDLRGRHDLAGLGARV